MTCEYALDSEDAGDLLRAFLYDWFECLRADNSPRWNPLKSAIWSRVANGFKNKVVNNDIQIKMVGGAPGGAYYDFRETTQSCEAWFDWNILRPVVPGAPGTIARPPGILAPGYCSHVFSYDITALPPATTPTGIVLQ